MSVGGDAGRHLHHELTNRPPVTATVTHVPVRYREATGFEMRCESCHDWWPLELDYWQPRQGMRRCRACWREYQRAFQVGRRSDDAIRAAIRASQRMKYWANRDVRLAAQRRWRAAHKEHVAAYNRRYRTERRAA